MPASKKQRPRRAPPPPTSTEELRRTVDAKTRETEELLRAADEIAQRLVGDRTLPRPPPPADAHRTFDQQVERLRAARERLARFNAVHGTGADAQTLRAVPPEPAPPPRPGADFRSSVPRRTLDDEDDANAAREARGTG